MNIVRISAGLGNQMFQYAFYLALKHEGEKVAIDTSEFLYRKHHQGYELQKVYAIEPVYATKEQVNLIADTSKSFWASLRRNVFKISRNTIGTLLKEPNFNYQKDILKMQDTYFQGFWQSWRYFDNISDEVKAQFTFRQPFSPENQICADAIAKCQSVAIHIRRGDYTKKRRWEEIGSICSLEYYNWAIAHINAHILNPHFFIFSDDIKWAHKNIPLENATFIEWNKGEESYNDLHLMSLCKHIIIANSSFSWWGAYLNTNPDKIVIAPAIWYRHTPTPDIIPQSWITLPID
ncbi:MAG: alpha-1,2-fucosyltransferase [Muribaculaceae bacterium]